MSLSKRIAPRHGFHLAGALLTLLLLGGCAPRQPAGEIHHYTVGTTLAPPAQQVFVRSLQSSPRTLDPSLATDVPGYNVLVDLFQGLTQFNAEGQVVPGVATHWTTSRNGLRWTFYLRPDARWSNGAPVTAQDFVYSWQREVNPDTAAQYAESLSMIVNANAIINATLPPSALGVHALGAHELVVDLVEPTPYLPAALANEYFDPLYPPAIRQWGLAWTRPPHLISNGAFYLASEVVNGRLVLRRNPYFWNVRAVHLREEIDYPLSNAASKLDRYLADDLDFADDPAFPPTDVDWLRHALGTQVHIAPYYGTAYLGMLVHEKPFDNRDLRLALSMALERKVLNDKLARGLFISAYSLMPPLPGYTQQVPDWAHWPRARRLAEARRLYAAAGYGPGHELRVKLLYDTQGSAARQYMEALTLMWKENLGADVRLWNEQWKVMLQDIQYKNAKLYWSAWIGNYLDPNTFMHQFQVGYAMNYGDFSYAPFQKLLQAAQSSNDNAQRYQYFEQAERVLGTQMPYIPLYFYTSDNLVKPYVTGWHTNLLDVHPAQYIAILQHTVH